MEMDFHTLSRRQLQALCKKNKIPANMTNLAMADALASLPQVEGLEELHNPPESDTDQLMEKDPRGSPNVARTATRMSTRRKPAKEQQEPDSSSVLSTRSRRTARKVPDEKAVQEFGGTNLLDTPATRRKVQAASTRRRAEIVISQDEGNKIVPEDSLMESRQEKPPVQKVYSTRRSVRMLEKTVADLTLATTIEPIKMNELTLEIPSEEEVKNAVEANAETVLVDDEALLGQNRSGLPENETGVDDGTVENQGIDNSSEMSAGVEPALLGSDTNDDNRHEVDQMVHNSVETALDLEDGCDAIKTGDNIAAEIYETAPEVENPFGVPSAASAIEDYEEEYSPSEGPAVGQNLEEILSVPEENSDEPVSENVMEMPSLPEDQVGSPQQLQSGSLYATSEPPIVLTCNLDQQVPECNAARTLSVSAVTNPEVILPTSAKAPEKIQSYAADTEASTDGFVIPRARFAGEINEMPQAKNTQIPTFANTTDVVSPAISGKLSNKKQSPPKEMENILDENKENMDGILRAEVVMEKAKKMNTDVEEDSMLKQLNEKSLRQLTKMLKEKLQISKKSDDVSEQQPGKIRKALQALPDNCMAVGKTGETD